LPIEECVSIAKILLNWLIYLQNNHLIHRDIKPGNVLIINGEPMLTDFGLAIDFRDANSIVGTPGYVPPENHGTVQGDIYSLGKLLYTISTGRSAEEFGYTPRTEADISSPLFPYWLKILNKACAPRLSDRYFSPKAMLDDIAAMYVVKRRFRWKPYAALVAVILVIAINILLILFYKPHTKEISAPIAPVEDAEPTTIQNKEQTQEYEPYVITKKQVEEAKADAARIAAEVNNDLASTIDEILSDISKTKLDIENSRQKATSEAKKVQQNTSSANNAIYDKAPLNQTPTNQIILGSPEASQQDAFSPSSINFNLTMLPSGLYICKYEVTQVQWQQIMGYNPSEHVGANNPVDTISWNEVQEFIRRLNSIEQVKENGLTFRLPTLSEWQYACGAGSTGDYGLLENNAEGAFNDMAWHRYNSGKRTHPVGTKKPNAWGLYDMHGNLWEMTYSPGDEKITTAGGCWGNSYYFCRISSTAQNTKDQKNSSTGFRLVAEK
jgi:formylglycine-generating enzyme required for sulfatase activity